MAKLLLFMSSGTDISHTAVEIKDIFERLKQETTPDLIFTHCRHDLHQDHRLLCELTWNTWRDHFILEYEIPKYDGDLGSPNFFVHLDKDLCDRKTGALVQSFRHKGINTGSRLKLSRQSFVSVE